MAESETKHSVRSHEKNAENAIFRTRGEGTPILGEDIMLGIIACARKRKERKEKKKGSPVFGAWTTLKV